MNENKRDMRKSYLLYLAIFCILFSFFIVFFPGIFGNSQVAKMQRRFTHKIEQTHRHLSQLKNAEMDKTEKICLKAESQGISILIYKRKDLLFWSDKNIPLNAIHPDSLKDHKLIKLDNYLYYIISKSDSVYCYYGLIQLESNFPYQNRFLRNGIRKEFGVPNGCISTDLSKGLQIVDEKGDKAFSVIINPSERTDNTVSSKIATGLLFTGIVFLLLYFRHILLILTGRKRDRRVFLLLLILLSFRLILFVSGILNKDSFYLFDPYLFATPVAPTFGDQIFNTLIFLFICYLIYKYLKIPVFKFRQPIARDYRISLINLIFVSVLFIAQNSSSGMITHSSLDLLTGNVSQLSFPAIVVYFLFGLNYLAVFLVALWAYKLLIEERSIRIIVNCSGLLFAVFFICLLSGYDFDYFTVFFGIGLYIIIHVLKDKIYSKAIFTSLIVLFAVFSIYILLFVIHFYEKKEVQQKKSFAISLSNEHDPIAEYLFDNLTLELRSDTHIVNSLQPERFDIVSIYNYLTKNYFSGFWKKYDLRITVCSPVDSVLIVSPENKNFHCYEYFEGYIENSGIEIAGSDFYFLNNYSGMIGYLGWIKYKDESGNEVSLFLELESKLTSAPLGYPELLLDEKLQSGKQFNRFSSAKYFKNKLVSHAGLYPYSLNSDNFRTDSVSEFYTVFRNQYSHLVYRADKNNLVIISEKEFKAVDVLILFSYFFVFYYLVSLLCVFLFISRYRKINFRNSLRNRIQFSVVFILILSLFMIAGSTIWFNIHKYNQTQMTNLKEKIQSVYVEVDRRLAQENVLTWQWKSTRYDNLNQLLSRISDLFYCDINLYSPQGDLLSTSRPEIFHLGLQNEKMDPYAFSKMHSEQLALFVHRENINKLHYQSAYIPFTNYNGQLLGYINIPYFTRQKELQEDITTLTVAILNIYVLLILLTIVFAVFISEQITKPLELLQARFRVFTLGGKYEQIAYQQEDEVGRLVEEYNKMVIELERSVELLARSERETAWREMAKQVAHEIKNPLTPMRLSVQQLQRAWDDKREDFDQYLKRVSKTIIEQIDTLSAIASEFSNFAKMPVAKLENVEVGSILSKSVELFHGTENICIELEKTERELHVQADAEQLNRVFINIIKNGIQSIPEDKEGLINIVLYSKENTAIIEIRDNGKGISDEVKQKMFMPNFTTKTSGMGLGLAIVQNILEQINGEITFKTRVGHGTTFIISLPLIQ